MTGLPTLTEMRQRLLHHVRGEGLEIGAYHSPLEVNARVRYVDLLSASDAEVYFPEASEGQVVVSPDIIAEADALPMLGNDSQDFVLNNELLEHVADPIKAIKEWHRILRPQGLLFVGLPDKRYTFDRHRRRTTLSHLVTDHRQERDSRKRKERDYEHYREWSCFVNGIEDPAQMEFWARLLEATAYPIHFHCWIPTDIRELFRWLADEERVCFSIQGEAIAEGAATFAFLLRAEK